MDNLLAKKLTCRQCGKEFSFSSSEQEFYQQKGFSLPNHCKECRVLRRASPILCAKCGQKLDGNSVAFCATCQQNVRTESETAARQLQAAFAELSLKLEGVERAKKELADRSSAESAAAESERFQLDRDEARIAALEAEKTLVIADFEKQIQAAELEKTALNGRLEQEKRRCEDLQSQLNAACSELEKALKYRTSMESLEPELVNLRTAVENLARNQMVVNQTLLDWARESAGSSSRASLVESLKKALKLGGKSVSPAG